MDQSNKIVSLWTSGLTDSEKEEYKKFLNSMSSNKCLVRLKDMVIKKRLSLESSERNPEIYRDNSWAYLQAHNNGARQSLKYIEDLLSFVE